MTKLEIDIMDYVKVLKSRYAIAKADYIAAKERLDYGFEHGYSNEAMRVIADEMQQTRVVMMINDSVINKLLNMVSNSDSV